MLEEAGLYGLREPWRDYAALRKLWNMIGGTRDERRQKMCEALRNGIDQACASGQGLETVLFWAQITIERPGPGWDFETDESSIHARGSRIHHDLFAVVCHNWHASTAQATGCRRAPYDRECKSKT